MPLSLQATIPGRREALLLVASLGVVPALLLAAEGVLAVVAGDPADEEVSSTIDRLHRYSEVYGWEPRPGRYTAYGSTVTINEDGYRGARLPPQPAAGRQRVLVLGDSIAFGLYVGDDETYAARLQALNSDLEVANLGVQGYGPGQSLLRLERLGLGLEPDVVVLALCLGNDFADAVLPSFLYDDAHPKPYFREEGGRLVRYDGHLKLGPRRRMSVWLDENSRLFRALRSRPASGSKEERAEEPWTKRRGDAMRDREAAAGLVARLAMEMRDLAVSSGARFLVLLHPDRVAGPRGAGAWEDALVRRLEAGGVESLSLADAYAARGLRYPQVTIDTIGHLSAAGHEATAAALAERLRRPRSDRSAALMDTGLLPLR